MTNWEKLEREARKALARNAAEIDASARGIAAHKAPAKRKRGKGKRFGAGFGRAS
jgi:hypothetical protein